jgi:hypothetical protein
VFEKTILQAHLKLAVGDMILKIGGISCLGKSATTAVTLLMQSTQPVTLLVRAAGAAAVTNAGIDPDASGGGNGVPMPHVPGQWVVTIDRAISRKLKFSLGDAPRGEGMPVLAVEPDSPAYGR